MTTGTGAGRGGHRGRPPDDAELEAIAARAEQDAGADRRLLGTYVVASAKAALADRRLDGEELDECRRLGEGAAEEGIELPRLLDLYLSATWRLSEALAALAPQIGAGGWPTALFRASDDAAAALGDGYQRAQRRAIRRDEALRREFVDDVLGGHSGGDSLRELAEQVGFNLAGAYQVVAARTDRPLRDAGPVQAHVERSVLGGRDDGGFVATKDGLLVCVLPAAASAPGAAVLHAVTAAEPRRWCVGVGQAHAGTGGVARSFREARQVLEIAARLGVPDPVATFSTLSPFRVLLQDPEVLRETVDDVLGPLAGARGGADPLVETLEAYFDEGLSTTGAARRLHLSVRAVTYRLDRIAALTDRSLRNPLDRFVLEFAVRGRRLLGTDCRDPATPSGPDVRLRP